ncbi:DNA polymerase IV [Deferrisoma sp.]
MPEPSRPRTILHVDMDAFYASVEVLDRPELRGKPVIVGADPQGGRGRGVVAAASYEARRFGVRSALPISQAWKRCPQGVYLRPRFGRYEEVSRQVFAVFGRYTDRVEPLSIDEAFLDLTGCERLVGDGPAAARRLKDEIRRELGLTASVGVAPNKFLAKIASDLDKPDGLVVVPPGEEAAFLAPLPVTRIWGVGPRTAEALARIGVRTVGDLQRLRREDLAARFGSAGADLWRLARGLDDRPVEPPGEPKSLGAEMTFPEDVDDRETVRLALLDLCDRVGARLRRHGLRARGVTLKFRDEAFRTVTRAAALEPPTDLGEDLFGAVEALLGRVPWPRGGRVRLVGVQAGRLVPSEAGWQPELFARAPDRRRAAARARDAVEERFGRKTLVRAALLDRDRGGKG